QPAVFVESKDQRHLAGLLQQRLQARISRRERDLLADLPQRIAGHTEFRKHQEIDFLFACLAHEFAHPAEIVLYFAEHAIHLCETYAHSSSRFNDSTMQRGSCSSTRA